MRHSGAVCLVLVLCVIGSVAGAVAATEGQPMRDQVLAACENDYERSMVASALDSLGIGSPQAPGPAQVAESAGMADPCGTARHLVLTEVAGRLRSKARAELVALMSRPAHLDKSVTSAHFEVWYTDDSSNHPSDAVTQQYAQKVSDYLEKSWSTEIASWGYRQGASASSGLFQVWIHDLGGAFGETFDFSTGSGDVQTYCKIGIMPDLGDDSLLLSTCAHEYHHASEVAYISVVGYHLWVLEASTAWIEYQVRKAHAEVSGGDSWSVFKQRVEYYQDHPGLGLEDVETPGVDPVTETYDGCLLFYFLANNTRTGSLWPGQAQADIARRFWECLAARGDWSQVFDAFDDALADAPPCHDTFTEVFRLFTVANLLDDRWYPRSDDVTSDTDFRSAAFEWDNWFDPLVPVGGSPYTIAGATDNLWSADYIRTWYASMGFLLRSDFEGEGGSNLGLTGVHGDLVRPLPVRPDGSVRTAAWETGLPSWVDCVDYVITRTQPGGTGDYELAVVEVDPPSVGAALDWLRLQQGASGAITESQGTCGCSVGKTALAVLAMLNNGDAPCDPALSAGLQYILSNVQWDGSIHSGLSTYETSLAVLALVAARRAGYEPPADLPSLDPPIINAVDWLVDGQNLEAGFMDDWYGGWGYDANYGGWSDLSNTQFPVLALEAAHLAGLYPGLPASLMDGTGTFVSRCWNDPVNPWTYSAPDCAGGYGYKPDWIQWGDRSVCGSMTSAALWCLEVLERHGIETLQVTTEASATLARARQSALDWLLANPSVTENPGAATYYGDALSYYYYYLYSAAKGYILADAGEAWYDGLTGHLGSTQSTAGNWPGTWHESDVLGTEWAALALETRAPAPPGVSQELWIMLNSPADLYVTDPLGRHIGADPITHDPVNEIPGATYSGPGTEPQQIVIPDPVRGTYLIQVVGTGTGTYTLSMMGISGGEQVSHAEATGVIASGVVDPYDAVVTSVTSPLDIFLSPGETDVVEATVELHPRSLDLKRRGNWVTCYIELPPGYSVEAIAPASLLLQGTIPCEQRPIEIGDKDEDGIPDLMVKFDGQALAQVLLLGESAIALTGELSDGTPIGGGDIISVHEGPNR